MANAPTQRIGWYATLVGVAMLASSLVLGVVFGVPGSFHDVFQLGGLAVALGGYFGLGGRKYLRRKKEP